MIKVLWISNVTFPEAEQLLKRSKVFNKSGGWLLSMSEDLIKTNKISLSILSVSPAVKEVKVLQGESIVYYLMPEERTVKCYKKSVKKVAEMATPDIVHIQGTEFPYGKAFIEACGAANVVVSIQGLISVISNYYYANLTKWEILRNITIRDFIKTTIFDQKREFKRRGKIECETIMSVQHIIGRTSFDRAHTFAINPDASYYVCNESLRQEFYDGCWSYDNCQKHTIFLSQSSYPLKGLHQLLKAMPIILRSYPDTKIRIAGSNIFSLSFLHQTGYGQILKHLIQKYSLYNCIEFTGPLTADQIKNEYLRANLFLCPSSIENSSNSLGEAQILGVPCVASFVGGIPDMIPNNKCGTLYRFDDVEMLAYCINTIFENSYNFDNSQMRETAKLRHDRDVNVRQLMSIYDRVASSI